jgi:hypothetical protein
MVATQQVGEKMTCGLIQGKADCGLTCRKWWLHPMPKSSTT